LILSESVIITTFAGFIGLVIGKGILLLIDWLLSMAKENIMIQKTELDIQTALFALIILIISGAIAGAFPAIKASTIAPINAIQYENGR
jgi:putative ABC transport system permease protein